MHVPLVYEIWVHKVVVHVKERGDAIENVLGVPKNHEAKGVSEVVLFTGCPDHWHWGQGQENEVEGAETPDESLLTGMCVLILKVFGFIHENINARNLAKSAENDDEVQDKDLVAPKFIVAQAYHYNHIKDEQPKDSIDLIHS